jgi:nitroreductase
MAAHTEELAIASSRVIERSEVSDEGNPDEPGGALLQLTPDELLTTTRAVRQRLDFSRPVPRELIVQCVGIALQAPTAANMVTTRFVVVTDPAKRDRIGRLYREAWNGYMHSEYFVTRHSDGTEAGAEQQVRVAASAGFLAAHMHEAPALVIACSEASERERAEDAVSNALPAMWSFMLAARARGLGTAWTTLHLEYEKDIADALGIPYDRVAQAVLTPVAFTSGTRFRPARRPAAEDVIHWDRW